MTYTAQETSVQSGAPIELYAFTQDVNSWYYTSSEADYVDASESPTITYTSASIERSEIASTEEKARNALTLTVPRTLAVAELFRASPPSETIGLIIRRVHRGDPSSSIATWSGRVIDCGFEGAAASFTCEPITVSIERNGLRRLYRKNCPFALYGDGCKLDKTDFDHATTVSSISGSVLTVASVDVSFSYGGGFVEWVNDDGITDRRFIVSANSTALTLLMPFSGIATSDAVTIYPGCDHTLTTCDTVFSNAANYGGFPWFPTKNPFAGDPIV